MSAYELPTSLTVGGVDFFIRTDFRAVLDILIAMNDPELDNQSKAIIELMILYKDYEKIPPEHIEEALEKASWFIDAGQEDDGKKHPKLVDWEQDANLIIPAINKVAHTEVRAIPEMHWWTFMSYYMEIGESTFSSVVSIRKKKAEHKKLEKYEREYYKENSHIIDFKKDRKYERSQEEIQALKDLWGD